MQADNWYILVIWTKYKTFLFSDPLWMRCGLQGSCWFFFKSQALSVCTALSQFAQKFSPLAFRSGDALFGLLRAAKTTMTLDKMWLYSIVLY